jgi:hypothetical protein
MSKASGSANTSGVAVGRGQTQQDPIAPPDRRAAQLEVRRRDPVDEGQRRVVAQGLLEGRSDERGVMTQLPELLRVPDQGVDGVGELVDQGEVAADQEHLALGRQFFRGHPAVLLAPDQEAEQVVARTPPAFRDQPQEVALEVEDRVVGRRRLERGGAVGRTQELRRAVRPRPEGLPVLRGDAEAPPAGPSAARRA